MAEQTATVEVLTAEVRVLMVGSRQVTLSVAAQLDKVSYDQIEPFGRVRTKHGEELIGRSMDGGTLVRAEMPARVFDVPYVNELTEKITVCDRLLSKGWLRLTFGKRSINVSLEDAKGCNIPEHSPYYFAPRNQDGTKPEEQRCAHWLANGMDDEIEADIAAHDEAKARSDWYWSLPLIVLAGLK